MTYTATELQQQQDPQGNVTAYAYDGAGCRCRLSSAPDAGIKVRHENAAFVPLLMVLPHGSAEIEVRRRATMGCATAVTSQGGGTGGLERVGRCRRRDLSEPGGPDGAQAGDGDGVRAPEIGLAKRPADAPVGGLVTATTRAGLFAHGHEALDVAPRGIVDGVGAGVHVWRDLRRGGPADERDAGRTGHGLRVRRGGAAAHGEPAHGGSLIWRVDAAGRVAELDEAAPGVGPYSHQYLNVDAAGAHRPAGRRRPRAARVRRGEPADGADLLQCLWPGPEHGPDVRRGAPGQQHQDPFR